MQRSSWTPAEFGQMGLRHAVDVFVYRFGPGGPEYLLLISEPRREESWRPVTGAVGWDEDLRRAALRRVRAEVGLDYPHDLVLPAAGLLEEIGDLRLVHWPFGFQLAAPACEPRPRNHLAGWQWTPFAGALDVLASSTHRRNLVALHLRLAA
jgi:ADP-ribose pyrophosphatase YjhB (NUDIX family)